MSRDTASHSVRSHRSRIAPRRRSPYLAPLAAFLLGSLIALIFARSARGTEPVPTGFLLLSLF